MAFDDPIVIILIVVAVIFLFGGSKIPGLAKALGEARREFDRGFRGQPDSNQNVQPQVTAQPATSQNVPSQNVPADDPLVSAAQREGIDTRGKTREQIASELSWKLNKK